MVRVADLITKFQEIYGARPRVYRAPGRVNLIGEHTDYNDGFVMPAALNRFTWIAVTPRDDRSLVMRSTNYPDVVTADLDNIKPQTNHHWSDYVRGTASVLENMGHRLRGANLLISGEVPVGAGLSSSAALEVSTGFTLLDISGIKIDRMQLALACQRAEHEFAGTRCGIMDQFISCFGRAEHALMLDTRSLTHQTLPLPQQVRVVICNSMVKHDNATGEYNARRAECETGVRHLGAKNPAIRALRDATLSDLERSKSDLSDTVYRRCRHVICENARVQASASALGRSDFAEFGHHMYESHRSLRDDYEVTCRELDVLVELASNLPGVYGARMTGAGFGGCTVNLVRSEQSAAFQTGIAEGYEKAVAIKPEIYVCTAAQGAEQIDSSSFTTSATTAAPERQQK
jgi:galactokinase